MDTSIFFINFTEKFIETAPLFLYLLGIFWLIWKGVFEELKN